MDGGLGGSFCPLPFFLSMSAPSPHRQLEAVSSITRRSEQQASAQQDIHHRSDTSSYTCRVDVDKNIDH
ncbi:hypothetical protein EYF80_041207 [Liparis tanakae]|uniref:Uncharacterized protein n=1 Tax=Liparis tanakae TaxID=230148 RepID=A0A4Z2G4X0_9TELE|nr:hypothetical protein EYF80_041207 [Liparis tanakae]